jgi:hypothetical protein
MVLAPGLIKTVDRFSYKKRLPTIFSAGTQTLQLIQPSFAKRYLMNARLGFAWALAMVIDASYHSEA